MSLLPEAGGETAVLDAQGTEQGNHRGRPSPAARLGLQDCSGQSSGLVGS
jgi:hypothetical protein